MHVSVCVYVCVTTAGVVSTVAGSTVSGYVDGVGTVAKFYYPTGISVDSTGNAWVADSYNHMIRKINTAGRVHTCMLCVCAQIPYFMCVWIYYNECRFEEQYTMYVV